MAAWLICAPIGACAQKQDGLPTSAEYIAGFVRYVRWQNEDRLSEWTVCVVGDLPAAQDLAYADRRVRDKPFKVRRIAEDAPLDECEVLDLTAMNAPAATKLLERVRHRPILAVGSGSSFCSSGGQICLHLAEQRNADRQKFEVNISAVREASLSVSARLLTLGTTRSAREDTP